MNTLVALALSTPIWGFSLQPPTAAPSIVPQHAAQVSIAIDDELSRDAELEASAAAAATDTTMMDWTRNMSLASVAAMAVAAGLGLTQFADEYGFHGAQSRTACANGDAVFSDCGDETPWPHVLAVGATAGLGLTTFVLSTQVDYEAAARRDGDWRIYEVTRWVGLGMFVVQAAGGFLLANAVRFGWADEQRDFGTLQALAAGHMAWGVATLGLETYNTAIMF
ncbi:MAG: hypothetical protein M3Y87_06345 [Myxococcota bacterium]|nr:hypothetical protein [Myxococcota bacterium]